MNTVKTALLLGLLTGVLMVGGEALGGRNGLYLGLLIAIATNFFSYFFSDRLALMSYSAEPVTPQENSDVFSRVSSLVYNAAQKMGLPRPKLWLIQEDSPNAFATGRNPEHASVAFTSGILQLMNDRELEGVIMHELGHVKHRDILISSVAATLAAAITFLARAAMWFGPRGDDEEEGGMLGAILMMILAPLAAMLIQMAISRTREYDADKASANYTGDPGELISALKKLETWSQRIPMNAVPATAHLFIMKPANLMNLFSTHPRTEDRIARLEALQRVHAR